MLGNETEYTYDQQGNLVVTKDANGRETKYTYDTVGNQTSRTLPLGMSEFFEYDAAGNLVQYTDFNGKTTLYQYNNLNQLVKVTYPDYTTEEYIYNINGLYSKVIDSRGTTTYSYDILSRLTRQNNPDGTWIAYEYDDCGNITAINTSNKSTEYTHDELGRITKVCVNDEVVAEYEYDKVNNIINDNKKKSKKIKFGKKTYDLKDDAQRQEYIQKYIMTRAISGLKPNEIYGDISINPFTDEDGKEMFSLSTQQLVGGGQQEKVVTGGIGERNYAFALNKKIFKKLVKQLIADGILPKNFDVESLDFIREKGDFKSNEMGQLAISRLGHLFGKTKDKKGFVDALKKSPLGSFITGLTKDGSGIEFSESDEAMSAFINNGGLTSLYDWMSKTDLSVLGIDENGKIFDKDAKAFVYETEAGLADVFKWTKRVQTGKKEREAQMRTAAVSGSSSSYTKQLQERYKGSNAKDRKIIEKAEHDIAEIESAIFEKTSSTASWDDKRVSDFIKTSSYAKGSKDTSRTAITMGAGDQYSINTEKYKDVIAEYQRGHISEEDFMKTWEGEVETIRKEMIDAGIDPSQIETIIDPGQVFGFSAFGDQYQGRLLHLGNTSPDSMIDPVTGKTVYNRSEYASGVNSLFKAMGSKAKNKNDIEQDSEI